MQKLSVIIPTYNCANILKEALDSVSWAWEIIVVDMGSTDGTIELSKSYGAKLFKRIPKNGNFDQNRKFGMEHAKGDWLLKLDSDEVLSKALQKELQVFLSNGDKSHFDGFNFYNRLFWFGKQIKHGCAKPKSHELRLVRKNKWCYEPFCFHQGIRVEGQIGFFTNYYDHYNYRTVTEFIRKTNNYTSLDATVLAESTKYGLVRSVLFPFATFFRLYFFQKGFMDGRIGFISSYLFAIYNSVLKTKIIEQHTISA